MTFGPVLAQQLFRSIPSRTSALQQCPHAQGHKAQIRRPSSRQQQQSRGQQTELRAAESPLPSRDRARRSPGVKQKDPQTNPQVWGSSRAGVVVRGRARVRCSDFLVFESEVCGLDGTGRVCVTTLKRRFSPGRSPCCRSGSSLAKHTIRRSLRYGL